MKINLENISHTFKGEQVFSPINFLFDSGSKTVIKGQNGSGKSTLLRVISTFLTPSSGSISYYSNGSLSDIPSVRECTTLCSPSLTLEHQFTLDEAFDFHFALRMLHQGLNKDDFFNSCFLIEARSKKISELSSGMAQRLKLAFAFLTVSDLLLLDEPCMNLDAKGIEMYTFFIKNFGSKRTHIVASNSVDVEFSHCEAVIELTS